MERYPLMKAYIDADFIVYKNCAGTENEIDFGNDVIVVTSKFSDAYNAVKRDLNRISQYFMWEEATRQGKIHIVTLTGRMEIAMVILWSRAFLGVMDAVKQIKAIGHSKTYDGVIRHMIEEAVCEWAVDL